MTSNWCFINKEQAGAIDIPGYKSRSYVNYYTSTDLTSVDLEGRWYPGVTVYICKSGNTLFEFFARNRWTDKCVYLKPEVSATILSQVDLNAVIPSYTSNRDMFALHINQYGNHVLALVHEAVWSGYGDVKLSNIEHSLPGGLVDEYSNEIVCAAAFPDAVKDLESAREVFKAVSEYSSSSKMLESDYYEKEKKSRFELINFQQNKIKELQTQLDNICEGSADALNILSDKYGIEVVLD